MSGLDVSFIRGLNVVIGPRGVGKTTFLELLRHALGAEHAEKQRRQQRNQFLDAILGPGEVIVDLESEAGAIQVIVDSKGRGRDDDLSQSVLVLGQSELEDIASDAANRLKLLDLRAGVDDITVSRGQLGHITQRMFGVRAELAKRREESLKRPGLEADRQIYRSQEESLIGDAQGPLATQRDALRALESRSSELNRRAAALTKAARVTDELRHTAISAAQHASQLEDLGREFISDDAAFAASLDPINVGVVSLQTAIERFAAEIRSKVEASSAEEAKLREAAAPVRESLEQAEAGLGQLTAQIRNIDGQLAELDDNDTHIASLSRELASLIKERSSLFDLVEAEEERVYSARRLVAESTSQQIDQHIVVVVEHLADATQLRDLLTDALRGTHTRAALIDSLAARVLPRLLLELVEAHDVAGLASAGDLSDEQALRVISVLDSPEELARLAQVTLKDSVDFMLRDGAVDKSVDNLSTGQKCAVTLPIVLSERDRTLILDQPEDHLDNAYLVDHVVSAMSKRTENKVQTIVATHNANIPVLGEAGRVFVLSSDGQRGAVRESGKFDEPAVVDAITTIMEGGREAFERRARFYEHHGEPSHAGT